MANFDAQKNEYEGQKKDIPRIHIDMDFLQKTRSKLVNFGLHGLLSILQTPIGGRHPVPYLAYLAWSGELVHWHSGAVLIVSYWTK